MKRVLNLEETLGPLRSGVFLFRRNRFTGEVLVNGSIATAHISDTGRLKELLVKGAPVLLAPNERGRLDYKLVAVKKEDEWVLVNTLIHSKISELLIKEGVLGFYPSRIKREVTLGSSRFDFVVDDRVVVEVKGCNLEKKGTCLFPDAPTKRGVKHLKELVALKERGYEVFLLFLLFRKCKAFSPNTLTDKDFAETLKEAVLKGLKVVIAPLKLKGSWVVWREEDKIITIF